MQYIIGIDPDVDKSGVATWNLDKECFVEIEKYSFFDLLDLLVMLKKYTALVRVEAGWLNKKSNYHKAQGPFVREKIAKNVGANHAISRLLIDFCKRNDIPCAAVHPLAQKKYWQSHEQFVRDTGWTGKRTNQDKRDAAFMAWAYNHVI